MKLFSKMKPFLFPFLFLFCFISFLYADFQYSTDFNDLDKDFFLIFDHGGYYQTPCPPAYDKAVIENGILKLPVNDTDHGPEMITKGMEIDSQAIIQTEFKVKVHYENKYFSGSVSFNLFPYSDYYDPIKGEDLYPTYYWDQETNQKASTSLMRIYLHNYYYGNQNSAVYGTEFTVCVSGNCVDTTPIWDDWFTVKVIINLKDKTATVSIPESDSFQHTFQIDDSNIDYSYLKYLKIAFSPYGWWTGHEMDLDYFNISITNSGVYNDDDNNTYDDNNTENVTDNVTDNVSDNITECPEDFCLTQDDIMNLIPGWNLVGSPCDLTDLSLFNTDREITLWQWDTFNKKWKIWTNIQFVQKLLDRYGISPVTEIKRKEGFWIYVN